VPTITSMAMPPRFSFDHERSTNAEIVRPAAAPNHAHARTSVASRVPIAIAATPAARKRPP